MKCPNCNHDKYTPSILGYFKCDLCGIYFLPPVSGIDTYYSSGEYREKLKQPNEVTHQKRRANNIIQYVGSPSVFIDIGCSLGILMDEVGKTGAECFGVDLDTVLAHDVYRKLSDVPKQADCITLIHSLEHMPHPLNALRDVYEKLNAGGRVVIEVPNGGVNVKNEYYRGAFRFPHVVMFDDESLAWTIQAAGFEIEYVIIHGNGGLVNAPEWYYLLVIGRKV